MCGINGIVKKGRNIEDMYSALSVMNDMIIHRGPDQDGMIVDQTNEYCLGMAMRRLSIIDLSTGKQPIFTEDGMLVIVFNGEIYNYKILRAQLENEGVSFSTHSDTEVILKLYQKYGVSSFSMLDGMFGLSIYDKTLNKVIIARDFFGEKPLYYYHSEREFYWASELKSIIKLLPIKPLISKDGLNLYFKLTYIPAPFSIYENILKLQANHYIEFDCNTFTFMIGEILQDLPVWDEFKNFDSAKQQTHDLVEEAIKSRMVSDVPIGTFLSGGVDSSVVSMCAAQHSEVKIDTFSIGFNKAEFDESNKSRLVAKLINSNHHEFIVKESDLLDNVDQILLNFDEPFADSSALASYVVAQKASQQLKVALTGDGGDEVFGGYNKYYMGKLNTKYTKYIPKDIHDSIRRFSEKILTTKDDQRGLRFKAKKLLKSIDYEDDFYYNIISLGFMNDEMSELIKQEFLKTNVLDYYKNGLNNSKTLADFRDIDRHLSLEGDMLVKVDRTSMLTSLECRAPFLSKDLWNFTNYLPDDYLIKGWDKKFILKKAFEKYFPKGFLDKGKKGFGVPVGDWLRGGLKMELMELVNKEFIDSQNLFHFEKVEQLVHNHLNSRVDNTFRVWTFFCFQKWYKNTYE